MFLTFIIKSENCEFEASREINFAPYDEEPRYDEYGIVPDEDECMHVRQALYGISDQEEESNEVEVGFNDEETFSSIKDEQEPNVTSRSTQPNEPKKEEEYDVELKLQLKETKVNLKAGYDFECNNEGFMQIWRSTEVIHIYNFHVTNISFQVVQHPLRSPCRFGFRFKLRTAGYVMEIPPEPPPMRDTTFGAHAIVPSLRTNFFEDGENDSHP
ncbi:hypothetical protein HanRHA438_Chr11g0520551 [Helianthus annuus]|nr:hypothetical protein HanRHA438_Chr11g0520551 [Helianthus annuus]